MSRIWDAVLRWLPIVLVALFVFLWLGVRDELAREKHLWEQREEAARLEAQGFVVASFQRERDLKDTIDRLVAGNVDLAGQLDRAKAEGLEVRRALRLATGQLTASGAARPAPPPGGTATAEAISCLLAEGDQGRIDVEAVELEGKAGSRVILGTASAWRVIPPPATRLFAGPFKAEASEVVSAEPPRERPGVGVGLGVMATREGWTVGPAVAARPLSMGPLRLDLTGTFGLGSGGVWTGGVVAVARRK